MYSRRLLRRPGAQVDALPANTNKSVQDEPGGAYRAGRQQSVSRAGVQRLVFSQHVQDGVGDVQLLLRQQPACLGALTIGRGTERRTSRNGTSKNHGFTDLCKTSSVYNCFL